MCLCAWATNRAFPPERRHDTRERRRFIRRRSLDHHLHQLEFHQGHSGVSNNASYSLPRGFISGKLSNQQQRTLEGFKSDAKCRLIGGYSKNRKKRGGKYLISNTKIRFVFLFSVRTNWATRLQSESSSKPNVSAENKPAYDHLNTVSGQKQIRKWILVNVKVKVQSLTAPPQSYHFVLFNVSTRPPC